MVLWCASVRRPLVSLVLSILAEWTVDTRAPSRTELSVCRTCPSAPSSALTAMRDTDGASNMVDLHTSHTVTTTHRCILHTARTSTLSPNLSLSVICPRPKAKLYVDNILPRNSSQVATSALWVVATHLKLTYFYGLQSTVPGTSISARSGANYSKPIPYAAGSWVYCGW